MSNSIKQWYSLYTKPGSEKKVANILTRKSIHSYCPLKRQWNGRKMIASETLFNSYVFVQITEADFQKVRMINGVVNFVYWLGKPAVIKENEIELMKSFLNEYPFVKIEKVPFNLAGDGMVRVIGGVDREDNKDSMIALVNNEVRILLPSLGYMMVAEVETAGLSKKPLQIESLSIFEKYRFNFKHRLAIQ